MDIIKRIERYAVDKEKIAQIYRDKTTTYRELKEKSDALASYIIDEYRGDKTPILVYGHKQEEMLICFFACTKAGHAYIPMDVTFPEGRICDIIESSGAKILLNVGNLKWEASTINVISKEKINDNIRQYAGMKPSEEYKVKEEENYYILYTSGSTGKPKGVQITKKNLESFVQSFESYCVTSKAKDIIMNQVSYSFDVSVINIYLSLGMGKTIYVFDKDMTADFKDLFEHLKKSNVNLWVSTPSYIEMCMADINFNENLMPKVERIILTGEPLSKKIAVEVKKRFKQVTLFNCYGPTEATVEATGIEVTEEILNSDKNIPIGKPLAGISIEVIDENGHVLPDGEKGELVLIGDQVSPGYYNNGEIVKKNFYNVEVNGEIKRAYRTGDIVYIGEDKLIYYCGRKDFQIKLNGQRIEIEDIENNIRALDFIQNAVVLPVYKDEKISRITAFVVLKKKSEEKEFKISLRIKEELKKRVQPYMIPRVIKVKESFITNTNGKINRKLLEEELK